MSDKQGDAALRNRHPRPRIPALSFPRSGAERDAEPCGTLAIGTDATWSPHGRMTVLPGHSADPSRVPDVASRDRRKPRLEAFHSVRPAATAWRHRRATTRRALPGYFMDSRSLFRCANCLQGERALSCGRSAVRKASSASVVPVPLDRSSEMIAASIRRADFSR